MSIDYKHGTCFAYWRDNRIVKVPFIQSIFTMKQNYTIPSYVNIDGTVVLTENKMLNDIVNEFNKFTDWSPHTEDIKADRIVKQSYQGSYANKSYQGKPQSRQTQQLPSLMDSYNSRLTLPEVRTELIKNGYSYSQVYSWDEQKCMTMHKTLMEALSLMEKDEPETKKSSSTIVTDMSIEEQIKFMLANGVMPKDIKGATVAEISSMFEELLEIIEELEKEEELAYPIPEEEKDMAMLMEAGYTMEQIALFSEYQKKNILTKIKDQKDFYENCTY
jgi:hypothetical protein